MGQTIPGRRHSRPVSFIGMGAMAAFRIPIKATTRQVTALPVVSSHRLGMDSNAMRVLTNCRNDHFDDGARIGIRQTQTASEFGHALSHASDTNADAFWAQLNYLLLYAFPVVTNRNHYNPVLPD